MATHKTTPLLDRLSALDRITQSKNQNTPPTLNVPSVTIDRAQGGVGTWGNWGGDLSLLRQSQSRQARQAAIGNPIENSLIFSALDWQGTTFQQAPFVVKRVKRGGTEEIVYDHPLTKLLKRPMDGWSRSRFWRATLLSRFFDGNAYWFKVPEYEDGTGVAELQWLHHRNVKPVEDPQTGKLIRYDYSYRGEVRPIPVDRMVHLRDGIDPANPHKGFARFRALTDSIASDEQIAAYEDIILHNSGVPVFSPPDDESDLTDKDADKIAYRWMSRALGGEYERPVVFTSPVKMETLSFRDFGLDKLHEQVEARVAMVTKLPAVLLQMLHATKAQSNRAGTRDMERVAWVWNIIPTQDEITEEIDTQLLADLGDPDHEFCAFDRREVEALKEDRKELSQRVQGEFEAGICDRYEARGRLDYPTRPEDKNVWGTKREKPATDKKPEDEEKPPKTDD